MSRLPVPKKEKPLQLQDIHYFEKYIRFNRLGTTTVSLLIAAAVNNQLHLLKMLLKPEVYNVCDRRGFTLLQIANLCNNVEVFDYMLSLPDFPFDFVSKRQCTALMLSLNRAKRQRYLVLSEHFPLELIRKGADTEDPDFLCLALVNSYFEVAKILIERGANVNLLVDGRAPLERALTMNPINTELVMTLLMSDAHFFVDPIDYIIPTTLPDEILEALIALYLEEGFKVSICWKTLKSLSVNNLALVHELFNHPMKVFFSDPRHYYVNNFITSCLGADIDILRLAVPLLDPKLKKEMYGPSTPSLFSIPWPPSLISENLEHLEFLLETEFQSQVITYIGSLNTHLMPFGEGESAVTGTYCYLLKYGLNLQDCDLYKVYNTFGYGECFRILLHMPVITDENPNTWAICGTWPLFIYHFKVDLKDLFNIPCDLTQFVDYFRDSQLLRLVYGNVDAVELFQVPTLLELARNTFRKYFIDYYKIESSIQFHSLVNKLPIGSSRKIITYQLKLY